MSYEKSKRRKKESLEKNISISVDLIIKLIISFILLFVISIKYQRYAIMLFGMLEIAFIFAIDILNGNQNGRFKRFIVSTLIFMLCLQCIVYYFGGSFISLDMLANISMIEDLGNNVYLYFACLIVLILVCFIRISDKTFLVVSIKDDTNKLIIISLIAFAFIYSFFSIVDFNVYENSPIFSLENLIRCEIETGFYETKYKNTVLSELADDFYHETSGNYISKPKDLSENPNIVLIFTEGISKNIIEDNRNIMPNVSSFLSKSLQFDNYYNHTFATYYGLSGQLFSGYQKSNLDSNSLISIQSILKEKGYYTEFINTEPNNKDFTKFLNDFGFDNVYNVNAEDGILLANKSTVVSDERAYESLMSEIERLSNDGEPYFVCLYTFGTHVNMGNQNLLFENGELAVLNRFYNVDNFFGEFFDNFIKKDYCKDTLLIFTGDHATYADADFKEAFPEYERKAIACDEMPLCFFYKGIVPKCLDVEGRNSLDLSPTILDYLDLEDDNYFLGNSLFGDETKYDTVFESNGQYFSTKGGTISKLSNDDSFAEIQANLVKYNSLKMGDITELENLEKEDAVSIYADDGILYVKAYIVDDYDSLCVALWSNDGDQSDLEWIIQTQDDNNKAVFTFDLSQHEEGPEYGVHIYGNNEDGQHLLRPCSYIMNSDSK